MTLLRPSPFAKSKATLDVARLYPDQGHWQEFDYLALTDNRNQLAELSDGWLQVLPMQRQVIN